MGRREASPLRSKAQAIHMATHDTALSLAIDDEPGTLSAVKWGDLVVLGAAPPLFSPIGIP